MAERHRPEGRRVRGTGKAGKAAILRQRTAARKAGQTPEPKAQVSAECRKRLAEMRLNIDRIVGRYPELAGLKTDWTRQVAGKVQNGNQEDALVAARALVKRAGKLSAERFCRYVQMTIDVIMRENVRVAAEIVLLQCEYIPHAQRCFQSGDLRHAVNLYRSLLSIARERDELIRIRAARTAMTQRRQIQEHERMMREGYVSRIVEDEDGLSNLLDLALNPVLGSTHT